MSMTFVFNFDGTWNGNDDQWPTNVKKFHNALDMGGGKQRSYYYEGPGNDEDSTIEHYLGGMLGIGCREIRDNAYETLMSSYLLGDEIAVTGFSRGAAIARMFCYLICKEGINGYFPSIKFLGCWDTVFARLPFGRFQQETLFGDLHVASNVQCARHAVALNEDRRAFRPNLMNDRAGIKEVWFKGNHADVGGGYEDHGLSDITLAWMVREASTGDLLSFNYLPTPKEVNPPHREEGRVWRADRRVGVKVGDDWSEKKPNIYSYN